MSSRRGVKQLRNQLFNGALFLLLSLQHIYADGNLGCLYSNQLCNIKTEWCFNDHAFGRCVYKLGFVSDDLYRYKFKYNDLEKLKQELEELRSLGFNWKHAYTQCIIQTQLYAIKSGVPYNGEICEQILKQDIPDPIRWFQYEQKQPHSPQNKNFDLSRPINEGIVKFEPDDKFEPPLNAAIYPQQSSDYENELMNQLLYEAKTKPSVNKKSMKSTSARYRGTPLYLPKHNRKNAENYDENDNADAYDDKYDEPAENENWLPSPADNTVGNYDDIRTVQKVLNVLEGERGKAYTEGGPMYISDKKDDYENAVKLLDQYGPNIFGFQRSERLDVKKPGPPFKVNNFAFRNLDLKLDESESKDQLIQNDGEELGKKVHRNVNSEKIQKEQKSEYEYVPINYGHAALRSENLQNPLQFVTIETNNRNLTWPRAHELLGSIRNLLRLPPGTFRNEKIHNGRTIYFNVKTNIINYSARDISRLIEETVAENQFAFQGFDIKAIYVGLPRELINNKEYTRRDPVTCDADSSEFALLQLSKNSDSWMEADVIVRHLNSFFNLPEETFYCVKSSVNDIAFKVRRNYRGLNASTVADIINANKDEINKRLHIEVVTVGTKSHDHLTVLRLIPDSEGSYYKLTFVMCGVLAAALVSMLALYFVKRQAKLKDKLHGLPREKNMPRDQHQQSFKSRISSKSTQEVSVAGQRITSLSRESDNSPSSRSSTSSWSEDPMTNMDVTTGHMVLAYMEDHLTNKARLDTEWAALCAYDADPCSVAIAQLPENIRKNRYVNALPYDHARVILNALSNVNGSDYINASTITDHDPRNPAYIATQGPLENTVCDFWQMLWEQGCNIVVMLTRLVENDTAMCYRYWPAEGVQLYNIYEIHLVSEHIWCDDFIIRSFYLKNQVTTETRTITQFHFLAWPEGSIPPAARSLLEFRRKVNKSFREKNHAIVVHCSDGVGRTGSYLLLDMVLNRIAKGAKEIDIAATLEHIRDHRAGAVCTKQQFQFVLSAVAEEVQAVLKALPQQQQSAQDQSADNVAPLVQLSTDTSELVPTTSGDATGSVLKADPAAQQPKPTE